MSRAFSCPHCSKPFQLTDEEMQRGKAAGQIVCPHCRTPIKVKKSAAPTASAPAPEFSPFGATGEEDPLAMPLMSVPLQPMQGLSPSPTAAPRAMPATPKPATAKAAGGSMSAPVKIGIAAGAVGALLLGLLCCGGGVFALTMGGGAVAADAGDDFAADAPVDAAGAPVDEGPLPPVVENFPPTPWTVAVTPPPEGPPMTDIVDAGTDRAPIFLPGCRDKFLRQGRIVETNLATGHTYEWLLVTFDPATGHPVGEPVSLGGEVSSHTGLGFDVPHRADMSPNGTLAIQTHGKTQESYSKVSVLEPGATELRRLDPIPTYQDWFGWAKDGRLLVVQEGKLHFWDLDGTAPALSVGAKYGAPVAITPARDVVFVTVDNRYLEAIDATTGEVRGRLGAHGQWKFLDVSPDGKRLAGVHWAEMWVPAPSSSPYQGRYDVVAFDLTTGKEIASVQNRSYGPPAIWAGPNNVYHDGKVFDFGPRAPIVALSLPMHPKPDGNSAEVVPVPSPDGRTWWSSEMGQAFSVPIPLEPKNGVKAFDEKTPIKLEVACDDPSRNAQVEKVVTAALSSEGRVVGSGDWTLQITTKRGESDVLLYDSASTMKAPKIEGEMKLVSPDKIVVATIYFGGSFNRDKTAYLAKKDDKDWQNPDTTIYTFDFGALDPGQAILRECWAQAIDVLKSIKRLPLVYKVDGKYVELPAPVTLELPAGVRTKPPGDPALVDPRTGMPIVDPRTGMPIVDPRTGMPIVPPAGLK